MYQQWQGLVAIIENTLNNTAKKLDMYPSAWSIGNLTMGRKKAPPRWQEGRRGIEVVLPADKTGSGQVEAVRVRLHGLWRLDPVSRTPGAWTAVTKEKRAPGGKGAGHSGHAGETRHGRLPDGRMFVRPCGRYTRGALVPPGATSAQEGPA